MAGSAGSPATAEGAPPAAEVAVTDSVPAAAAPGATAGAAEDAAAAVSYTHRYDKCGVHTKEELLDLIEALS